MQEKAVDQADWMELRLIEEDESGDKEVKVAYCWGWGRGWKTYM